MKYRFLILVTPLLVAFDNAPSWLTANKLLNPDRAFVSPDSPEIGYACYTEGDDSYTVKNNLSALAAIGTDAANWTTRLEESLLPTDACDVAICHGSQAEIDAACGAEPPPPPPPPPPVGELALSDYSSVTFVSTGPDASGIALLPDGNLMITRQTVLEIRNEAGQLLSSRASSQNDLEGIEYSGGLVYGVNESPGRAVQYDVSGQILGQSNLPYSGAECVAVHNGVVYYGHESTGYIADAQANIYIDLGQDLAGCVSAGGYLIAVTSHAWRSSQIHKIDTATWEVVETRALPTCDCEGIAFSADLSRMYIVQEASRGGGSGYTIYER
jgi:hypothetical protein